MLWREYQEINPTAMYSYLRCLWVCVCFRAKGPEESPERRKPHSLTREQHIRHRWSGAQDGRKKFLMYLCYISNLAWKPGPACKDTLNCRRSPCKASWCYVSDSSTVSISCLALLLQLTACARAQFQPGQARQSLLRLMHHFQEV